MQSVGLLACEAYSTTATALKCVEARVAACRRYSVILRRPQCSRTCSAVLQRPVGSTSLISTLINNQGASYHCTALN